MNSTNPGKSRSRVRRVHEPNPMRTATPCSVAPAVNAKRATRYPKPVTPTR